MTEEQPQIESEQPQKKKDPFDEILKWLPCCCCGCIGILFVIALAVGASIATGLLNVNPFQPGGSGNGTLSEDCESIKNATPEMIKAVNAAAAKYGIDAAFIAAVIQQESGWNPNAVSSAGARGMMQVMPDTWNGIDRDSNGDATDGDKNGTKDPFGVWDGIFAGTFYYKQIKGQLGSKYDKMEYWLAAYNAGPGAVQQYGGIPPYEETQNYVKIILKNYEDIKKCMTYSNNGTNPEWCWPTNTQNVTASFHDPKYPYGIHEGLDIAPQPGQWSEYEVSSVKEGTVTEVLDGCETGSTTGDINCSSKYGNHIIIDHGNGQFSTYAHLKKGTIEVHKGDKVGKKQKLAKINSSGFSSGDHLHLEIKFNGTAQDPQNLLQQCTSMGSCGEKGQKAVEFAMHQIGKNYIWGAIGGWDSSGFDCAGLFGSAWYYATGDAKYYHTFVPSFESQGQVKSFKPSGDMVGELQPGDGVYGGSYIGTLAPNTDFTHMGIYVGQVTYKGKTYQHGVVEARGTAYGVVIREFEEGSWSSFGSNNVYSRISECLI